MVAPNRIAELRPLRSRLQHWGALWGLPNLADQLSLRTSSRLRSSLGSYRPARAELTLAAWLLDGPEPLLEEVLCHEAAHAAAHWLHGRRAKPHGSEWRALMRQAGLEPRVRVPRSALPSAAVRPPGRWGHR